MGWSLPDEVASEVTSMSLMRIATASPGRAPSTATGWQTSCPPRIEGVIIGPQQPGVEFQTMWPPSATGPSIGTSSPSRPSVNVSTRIVWRASPVRAGGCWMAIGKSSCRAGSGPVNHRRPGAAGRPLRDPRAGAGARHARRRSSAAPSAAPGPARARVAQASEEIVDGRTVVQLDVRAGARVRENRVSPVPRRTRTCTG